MTRDLFLSLDELAAAGLPCSLDLATLEAVDGAGFSPGDLGRALLFVQSWADSAHPWEALERYESARWRLPSPPAPDSPAPEPAPDPWDSPPNVLTMLPQNGTEGRW